MQTYKTETTIENAIPVNTQMLRQLDAEGVEYTLVKGSESMSDFVWISVIPTTKSLLGLFHAGVHFATNKLKAA